MKKSEGYPDGSAVFKAAVKNNPREREGFRILMVYTRAKGVYTVLKDVIPNWTDKQELEVEAAVKKYIDECRENGWREKKNGGEKGNAL